MVAITKNLRSLYAIWGGALRRGQTRDSGFSLKAFSIDATFRAQLGSIRLNAPRVLSGPMHYPDGSIRIAPTTLEVSRSLSDGTASPPYHDPSAALDFFGQIASATFKVALVVKEFPASIAPGDDQLSSIESGDFSGLTNLETLRLRNNQLSSIEVGAFIGLTNLTTLILADNQLSSIESGDFDGLTSLRTLWLDRNQLSSVESGAFSGLGNLTRLLLADNNTLTNLNLAEADFTNLGVFDMRFNDNTTIVSLRNTVVNQTSLATLMDGGSLGSIGIGELDGITELDLSGIDFANITDLAPLYTMDSLIDLWLVDTQNLDAVGLDALLDNLGTIEGSNIEGVLHITEADYDAFNAAGGGLLAAWDAEPGHHVQYLMFGDMSHDNAVNGLDVDPFIDVLLASEYDAAADMNGDGAVNGLDVDPFVAAVVGDGGVQQIPEPSTLLLCLLALGVVGGWRRWGV